MLDDHVAGRADLSRQLWGLLAFTLWHEHHVEGVRRDAPLESVRRMKVWVDFTASAHPLVFRPLVERLHAQGHEVEITARDYAQTLQLIESHGMTATVIGHHGGRSSLGKARQMRGRLQALRQWAKGRNFDVALAHGSHELTMTARRLGIPSATTFDYEWAWLQHQLGCRAATRVVVPDVDPARAAREVRHAAAEAAAVPGPEGGVLPLGLPAERRPCSPTGASTVSACSSSCGRRPTCRSTTGTRTRSSRRRSSTSARSSTCTRS